MLDKQDKREIKEIIGDAFSEFWDKVLAPYLDNEHKEMVKRFDENDKEHEKFAKVLRQNQEEHDEMFVRLDRIEKKFDGHEKRLTHVETTLVS